MNAQEYIKCIIILQVMQTVILVKIKPRYQDIVKEKSRIIIAHSLFFFFLNFFSLLLIYSPTIFLSFQKRNAEHDQINGSKPTDNHDPFVRHRR